MGWGDWFEFSNDFRAVMQVNKSESVLTLEELPWTDVKNPKLHYPFIK